MGYVLRKLWVDLGIRSGGCVDTRALGSSPNKLIRPECKRVSELTDEDHLLGCFIVDYILMFDRIDRTGRI